MNRSAWYAGHSGNNARLIAFNLFKTEKNPILYISVDVLRDWSV
jgi:hypothetical protein